MSSQKNLPIRNKPQKKKFKGGIIFKIIPISLMLIFLQIATQSCAEDLNFDAQLLGQPFLIVKGYPIYLPYVLFLVYFTSLSKGYLSIGTILYDNLKIFLLGVILSLILYVILIKMRDFKKSKNTRILASGRWGTIDDLREGGLLDSCGVVIGQTLDAVIDAKIKDGGIHLNVLKEGTIVRYNMKVSAMVQAGTRLGKGISTVIPSHMDYPYSIISVDPKAENYEITGGWRKLFTHLYKYNPTEHKNSLHFNFLFEIEEAKAFRDANLIASVLTAKDMNVNSDPHWETTARVLITATILHVLCAEDPGVPRSLPGVYEFLSRGDKKKKNAKNIQNALLDTMINDTHCNAEVHRSIANYASQIKGAPDEEKGSIFSSALEALDIFNDTDVIGCSNESDFCLKDFKMMEMPISLYLSIPFGDLKRLKNLFKLFVEFICLKFSQEMFSHEKGGLKNRILIIMDEFPVLGRLEAVETFAGILNGLGISFLWIVQSKKQIDKIYGQDTSLYEHCRYIWTYAMGDDDVAQYYSKRVGTEDYQKENTSSSGNIFELGLNNRSISEDTAERSLLTANELETLPPEYLLLLTQGGYPQLLKKVAYYSSKSYKLKQNLPVPKTRKELLKECKLSTVIKPGDPDAWWEKFVPYSNDNEESAYNEYSFEADKEDEFDKAINGVLI